MGLLAIFLVAGAAFLLGLRVGIAVGHKNERRFGRSVDVRRLPER